ncbi:hypothetical protein ECAE60S_02733 [Eoetvoesiella caeni]
MSFYTSISGIVKSEMFPPEVRALGVGLAYALANAIFGGSAEYVALGLKSLGHENSFYWYVTGMMVLAFVVSLRLPKRTAAGPHLSRRWGYQEAKALSFQLRTLASSAIRAATSACPFFTPVRMASGLTEMPSARTKRRSVMPKKPNMTLR